jgi:hypothetical protein
MPVTIPNEFGYDFTATCLFIELMANLLVGEINKEKFLFNLYSAQCWPIR